MERTRLSLVLLVLSLAIPVALPACGGGIRQRVLDERRDLGPQTATHHIVAMPTGLHGTQWRWVEAYCTEGPLDLTARGFAQKLRVQQDGDALLLTYDQVFATEECTQTVVQRVSPPPEPGELQIEEIARVAVPSTPGCFGRPEDPRPGEVRRSGNRLEVLVQRSRWCGGFEVRMVYEPAPSQLLDDQEIARRYVAYFSRGDADRVSQLFAETGSLLEPFSTTRTGDPYRHDGRPAVLEWLRETLSGAPWRALRIVRMEPAEPHVLLLEWEYMDPRLAQPVRGRYRFTSAAGEIFEAQVELLDTPVPALASGITRP